MKFGVVTVRPNSHYEYDPFERFPFLDRYLPDVLPLRGQWILYYEPVSVRASRGYFAMAMVEDVVAGPIGSNLRYALIERGSYIDFAEPVPFKDRDGIVDHGLRRMDGRFNGMRKTVRDIASADFMRIAGRGLGVSFYDFNDVSYEPAEEEESPLPSDLNERQRHIFLGSRAVRDRIFRQSVLRAYDDRCAIFGWRLTVADRIFESQGAHIMPVDADGPDITCNGISLSATAHWLFDKKMISLSDDYEILVSRQLRGADELFHMLPKDRRISLPNSPIDRPHPQFLAWHRANSFTA